MRKVIFGGANSLDNLLARPDGSVDWLLWSKDVGAIMRGFWKTVDAVLMGRKTYVVGLEHRAGAATPGVESYVFSRTLDQAAHPNVEIVSEDAVGFVGRLKQKEGGDICLMGGGELARSLFEAGLVDEIGLNVHPVLLGRGIPLFHPMERQIDLELVECRRIENDCVYLRYAVKG